MHCCYPPDFEAKYKKLLAGDADAFFQSLAQPSVHGLRINPCKTDAFHGRMVLAGLIRKPHRPHAISKNFLLSLLFPSC